MDGWKFRVPNFRSIPFLFHMTRRLGIFNAVDLRECSSFSPFVDFDCHHVLCPPKETWHVLPRLDYKPREP